jgi:endonuclease G, mitochondrial
MEIKRTVTIWATSDEDESVVFTVPLEVTVRLHPDSGQVVTRSAVGVDIDATDGAIASAVALARRNRDLTPQEYYDEEADAIARDDYYRVLGLLAQPGELYAALSQLVTQTHRTKLDYKPAVHLYPEVDLQPNGQITSVYSGLQMDPEDLIRADADIDRARQAALRTLVEGRAVAMSDVAEFADRLEAALPFNCEHVVPQSWFAKRQPMKGDLHHLFACEIKCNSFRANIPYFDFDGDDIEHADCGQADPGKFEPLGGKGTVARATLYFLLRYPGEIDNNDREYTRERLNVLLEWTRDHPVTVHERHRNRLIQGKQGNRNPLIDHPDWAERIDFTRGLR